MISANVDVVSRYYFKNLPNRFGRLPNSPKYDLGDGWETVGRFWEMYDTYDTYHGTYDTYTCDTYNTYTYTYDDDDEHRRSVV